MNDGLLSVLIIFYSIFIFFPMVLAIIYQYVRLLQKRTIDIVDKTGRLLRQYKEKSAKLKELGKDYHPDDKLPYGSLARMYTNSIQGTHNEIIRLGEDRRRIILGNIPYTLKAHPVLDTITTAVHFVNWIKLNQQANLIYSQVEAINQSLLRTQKIIAKLNELPWTISQRAREIERRVQEIDDVLKELISKGVIGKFISKTQNQLLKLSETIELLPKEYLQANRQVILQNYKKDDIIKIFHIIEPLDWSSHYLIEKVKEQKHRYIEASEALSELDLAIKELNQQSNLLPPELVINEERFLYNQIIQDFNELHNLFIKPEVETIQKIAENAYKLSKKSHALVSNFEKYYSQWSRLAHNIWQNSNSLKIIKEHFEDATTIAKYPIEWGDSIQRLGDVQLLHSQIEKLINTPRTPFQIEQDINRSKDLENQIEVLSSVYTEAIKKRKEIISTWNDLSLILRNDWLEKISKLSLKTQPYDKSNWSSNDKVETLDTDAKGFVDRLKEQIPTNSAEKLREQNLEFTLQSSRILKTALNEFNSRINSIEFQLKNIQDMDKQTQEMFQERNSLVSGIREYLTKSGFLSYEGEHLLAVMAEANTLSEDLKNKGIGKVRDKYSKVQMWLTSLDSATKEFYKAILKNFRLQQEEIRSGLNQISKISTNIQHDSIREAQKYSYMLNEYAVDSVIPDSISNQYSQIRDICTNFQQIRISNINLNKVIDEIRPLENRVEANKKDAADSLKRLSDELNVEWEPVPTPIRIAKGGLDEKQSHIKRELNNLKSERLYLHQLLTEIERLSNGYEEIATQAKHLMELTQAEKSKIKAKVKLIMDSDRKNKEQLAGSKQTTPQNQETILNKINEIKQRYKDGGSYDEVVEELRRLEFQQMIPPTVQNFSQITKQEIKGIIKAERDVNITSEQIMRTDADNRKDK